jgi:hypothetical protein
MTDVAPWSAAVQLVLNAPSVRNVQPWRFMLRDDALDLHMSDDAFAEACDTTLRTVTISCGVVLHHLRVVLRATGSAIRSAPVRRSRRCCWMLRSKGAGRLPRRAPSRSRPHPGG